MSNDVERRLRGISNYTGQPLTLEKELQFNTITEASRVEQNTHIRLSRYLIFGEWFSCTVEQAEAAMLKAVTDPPRVRRGLSYPAALPKGVLLEILDANEGSIERKKLRLLVYPLSIGRAISALRREGVLEPWDDVITLVAPSSHDCHSV